MFTSFYWACPNGGWLKNYLIHQNTPKPGESAQKRTFDFTWKNDQSCLVDERKNIVFSLTLKEAADARAFWFVNKGGDGAHGVHGKKGNDGEMNVTVECRSFGFIPKGFPGKKGTDGENGSDGQNGGDGGNITIVYHPSLNPVHEKTWKLFKAKFRCDLRGGVGGNAGLGGDGGKGALGSCYMHKLGGETFYGKRGAEGADGKKGKDGEKGKDGSPGSLFLSKPQEIELTQK